MVRAERGLTGTFDNIRLRDGILLESTFGYDAFQAWLDITRVEVTAAAMALGGIAPSSMSSAIRLENAFQRIDAQLTLDERMIADDWIDIAGGIQQIRSAVAFATMLDSLSGKAHAAASAMTFDSIDLHRRALAVRFGELVDRPAGAGAWTQAIGGPGAGSFAGREYQVTGWMLGNDYRLGRSTVAGFGFGQTHADSAVSGGPEVGRDRQVQGQGYGGWLHGNAYALGRFGIGRFDRRIDRQLLLGSDRSAVQADYTGRFASAGLEAGYRMGHGTSTVTPYAGVEHARVESAGFHEAGGSGFGLRTGAIASSRTQVLAGLRAGRAWHGLSLRGYAEWQHAVAADGLDTEASFVGVDAWSPLSGLQPARSGGLAGATLETTLSRDATLSVGYDQRFGPRGDTRTLSLRYALGF